MPKHTSAKGPTIGVREQQRLQTRQQILQAGLNLFAERGFDGAVLRDIAAEAGVNHAMVKYHFENKENLWREAVTFLFKRCDEALTLKPEELFGKSHLEQIKIYIRHYIHYCAKHPEHARIIVQASIRDNARLDWVVDKFISKQHKTLMMFMKNGEREKIWPEGFNSVNFLYITASACQTFFMLGPEVKKAHGINVESTEAIEEYAETLLTLFFDHKAS